VRNYGGGGDGTYSTLVEMRCIILVGTPGREKIRQRAVDRRDDNIKENFEGY
jgi:hypothetical protein